MSLHNRRQQVPSSMLLERRSEGLPASQGHSSGAMGQGTSIQLLSSVRSSIHSDDPRHHNYPDHFWQWDLPPPTEVSASQQTQANMAHFWNWDQRTRQALYAEFNVPVFFGYFVHYC